MASKRYLKNIMLGLLIALGGWALFSLVRAIFQDVLYKLGITSEIGVYAIIVVFVIIVLLLLGFTTKKAVKKLSGG